MKITIKSQSGDHLDTEVSWKSPVEAQTSTEMLEAFCGLLVAHGYHPTSVNESIGELDYNRNPRVETHE